MWRYEAARQGPALGVHPVLIPLHPLHSILLVFSQLTVLLSVTFPKYVSMLHECSLVLTILRISSFCMAFLHSLHMSSTVVLFYLFDSPCGFAHLLLSIPNSKLNLFISPMYLMILLLHSIRLSTSSRSYILFTFPSYASFIIAPPIMAIWQAASLPLGSIIAYIKSSRLTTSLLFNYADVPIMEVANSLIATFISLGFKLKSFTSSQILTKFMILVRLATSIFFLERTP